MSICGYFLKLKGAWEQKSLGNMDLKVIAIACMFLVSKVEFGTLYSGKDVNQLYYSVDIYILLYLSYTEHCST